MNALHLSGPVLADDDRVLDEAWVVDGALRLSDPGAAAEGARTVSGWVVPGLVDVHCHVGLGPMGAVSKEEAEEQARIDRDLGTLLVRDAGSPQDTAWIHERHDLPRLIRSGKHLAYRKRYLRYFADELDDVTQLPEAVAREAQRGDGWVKIVADWIDRSMGREADLTPLWPPEVLADAVAAAHENGARITAHTFAHEAVGPLLDAGVDGLEHGTGMDADHIAEAASRGIAVTTTLLQVANFAGFAAQAEPKYPVFAARMRAMYARRYTHVMALHEAGVPLLMGSDAGGTIEHGTLPEELAENARAGLSPADVLGYATWRARDYLGVDCISEGASADVVVYDADPRTDVGVYARPAAVVLRGRLC